MGGASSLKAYYNENNKHAAEWLRNLAARGHIAPGDVDERSIEDVTADDVRGYTQCHWFAGIGGWSLALRLAGWSDSKPVWTGSCPCQPFSKMGRRRGLSDARHLWPVWFRLIGECRPPTVFGEQVAGAGIWLDNAFSDLESLDYACGAADLPAACIGSPQNRPRLWFVSHAKSERRGTGLCEDDAKSNGAELADNTRWPAKPSVSDVAHGIPGAVDFNRAIGNAIAPALAAKFIRCAVDAL